MVAVTPDQNVSFAAETRLHDKSDISSSRFKIWANVLSLVLVTPLGRRGLRRVQPAWTFTPSPPPCGLLTTPTIWSCNGRWSLASHHHRPGAAEPGSLAMPGVANPVHHPLTPAGACGVIVSTALLHSLLEYPLWYSYFLLPTAFAWGIGLASRARTAAPQPPQAGRHGA